MLVQHGADGFSASLCSPVYFLNSTVSFSLPRFIRAALPVRCLSRWIIPWSPWANLWKRVCLSLHVFMRLNALCEESSHWETGPNGTILVSGIGENGALRMLEAMCHSDSLMRPRRLEMLHRDCWQSSSPVQNPRPALRFRLDKRDERCGSAPRAAERGGNL